LRFLTLKDLYGEHEVEAALTYPFPPDACGALLERARDIILEHIRWVTNDLAPDSPQRADYEIRRCAVRLAEIVALAPAAGNIEVEKSIQIALERSPINTQVRCLKGFRRQEYRLKERRFFTAVEVETGRDSDKTWKWLSKQKAGPIRSLIDKFWEFF
jgi:hypothetical protein